MLFFGLLQLPISAQTIFDSKEKSTTIYQARFESALNKFSNGELHQAIEELNLLLEDTQSPRVKLELAKLLYLDGQNKASEKLFEEVLSVDPPFMVRERVGNYLEEIKTANGRFDYAFGITSDSNPRAITSDRSIVIGGLNYTYNPGYDLTNNYGLSYSVLTSKGLDAQNRWIVGLTAVGAKFENTAFDRTDLTPYLSYRILDEPKTFIKASFENYWMGGQKLFDYPNLDIRTIYEFPDTSYLSTDIKSGQMTYSDYDYLSGQFSQATFTYGKSINDFLMIGLDLGLDRNHAMVQSYLFQSQMMNLFGNILLPEWFLKGQLKFTIQNRVFDDIDPYFGDIRVDKKNGVYLTLMKTNLKILGLAPAFELGFEVNNSNFALYSYSRYIANLTFRKLY